MLAKDPDCPGSLGLAISEAVEDAVSRDDTHYSLGSVLNHVLLHQTIIGEETRKQMEMADVYPDIIVGCIGGGSNFAGMFLPFVRDKIDGTRPDLRIINVEPASCPTLTKGPYAYDFGDVAGLTPLLKMYTLGHKVDMVPIKGDGLRYHGCSPIISLLRDKGYIDTIAYPADEKHGFEQATRFIQAEGFLPAPESAYSVACAIDEALKCKESGEKKVIAFNVSGHGFLDIPGYREVLNLK